MFSQAPTSYFMARTLLPVVTGDCDTVLGPQKAGLFGKVCMP